MLPRYLTPFAFLALFVLGAWMGGIWTFMGAMATALCLATLDVMLGSDDEKPSDGEEAERLRSLPRTYIVLQLAANAWAAARVADPRTGMLDCVGLALSAGVTTGVFGFVAAHEMIHSRKRGDRAFGLTLLGSVLYMHFRIAHVHGHHVRAGTRADPATARLGEGLYRFWLRSIGGQLREAWAFEARRQRRRGQRVVGTHNMLVAFVAAELLFLIVIALMSFRALAFVAAVAVFAVLLLETFNYVAHYGLERRVDPTGRPERLAPHHSWNSKRRMNNAALFNMGRHSDHHRHMARPYAGLERLDGAAELPSGYAAALLTALAPPVWKKVMNPRAKAAARARPPL
jgi:alkane 1-monooxygenase